MKQSILVIAFLAISLSLLGQQELDLSYYLPDITYNENIPTPKEFLGYEVGEWHVTHDQLYYYMRTLAEMSDRITMTEYARSHEGRPLIILTITSPENHTRIDQIQTDHLALTNTEKSDDINISDLPVVIYQGCSIHGNEPSGVNGALATVYYLAAGESADLDRLLDEAVILFDPAFNPDGINRFATWANVHKGKNLITDPNSREYNEVWPRGRTNHYWFDLNRDWLLLTHPESQGRIKVFHEWRPDILTDHHEMGSNSTFFFQPGIPSRTNPHTPQINQDITGQIGEYHAATLDKIGSLYYTKESYDDYYYGKGSTYPDAQGSIGILFEQASSRGHLQETDHGLLSFPFTIRNQVRTMLSTQKAGVDLRENILNYKRDAIKEARAKGKNGKVKGYVFGESSDPQRVNRLIDILLQHKIKVYTLAKDVDTYQANQAYVVPMDQDQYTLAKTIFESVHGFPDSLFYDVSAWTLPYAFDIMSTEITSSTRGLIGQEVTKAPLINRNMPAQSDNNYAYLVRWDQHGTPALLDKLLQRELIVKQVNKPFKLNATNNTYGRGTLIIPVGNNQTKNAPDLYKLLSDVSEEYGVSIDAATTGLTVEGYSLGSRSTHRVESPKACLLVGDGIRAYDAGEVWHHFDQVLDMAVPHIDIAHFRRADLDKYGTIIMPSGNYRHLKPYVNQIKNWVKEGGKIIAIGRAISWLKSNQLISTPYVDDVATPEEWLHYGDLECHEGSRVTGGMITRAIIDRTHPLFYGYDRDHTYFFHRGNDYYTAKQPGTNMPARYDSDPIASGYLHRENEKQMANSAAVFVERMGRGSIICLSDNPLFRGYWWGSHRLFANALYYQR